MKRVVSHGHRVLLANVGGASTPPTTPAHPKTLFGHGSAEGRMGTLSPAWQLLLFHGIASQIYCLALL